MWVVKFVVKWGFVRLIKKNHMIVVESDYRGNSNVGKCCFIGWVITLRELNSDMRKNYSKGYISMMVNGADWLWIVPEYLNESYY